MSALKKHLMTYDVSALNGMSDYWKSLFFQSFILVLPEQYQIQPVAQQQLLMDIINGKPCSDDITDNYLKDMFMANRCLMNNEIDDCATILEKYEAEYKSEEAYLYLYFFYHCVILEWQEALDTLDKLVKLRPTSSLFHAFRGYLNGLARNHDKAMESCRFALQHPTKEYENLKFIRYLPHVLFQAEYLLLGQSKQLFNSDFFISQPEYNKHLHELSTQLTPIQHVYAQNTKFQHSFFVASDAVYFEKWSIPLILSSLDHGLQDGFHVHVINPDQSCMNHAARLKALLGDRFSFSFEETVIETVCPASIYYSCIRFCRMLQVMYYDKNKNYTLIDADMLINQPLDGWQHHQNNQDCTYVQGPSEPLWNISAAGYYYVEAKKITSTLLPVSSFILKSIHDKKYAWFLDQVAICLNLIALGDIKSKILPLKPDEYCDLAHSSNSKVWAVTNDKKAEMFLVKKNRLLSKYDFISKNFNLPPVSIVDTGETKFLLFSGKDLISNHLFRNLNWEKHITDFALSLIKDNLENKNIIDIGANLGSFALALAPHIRGYVYAFEPQRIIFQQLTGNVFLNRRSNVITYNAALGASASKKEFIKVPFYNFEVADNFGATQLGDAKYNESDIHHYEQAPLHNLDDYNFTHIGLIKIDVEGMEEEVLKGAEKTLKNSNFPPILFEMWSRADYAPKRKTLVDMFKLLGYTQINHLGADDYLAIHPNHLSTKVTV